MHHVVIESVGTVKGRVIEGVALVPTISENGNIYTGEEIDKAANLNTPLKADWEHTAENVGQVVYTLDPQTHTLFYRATITSESRASQITEGVHKVSIEAGVNEVAKSCTPVRCYNLVSGITMEGIGITTNPGVLSTTLSIIESKQSWNSIHGNCPDCISSLEHNHDKSESMTNSDKPCNCKESKTKEQECPDGKTWNPETQKCEAPPATDAGKSGDEKKENLGGGPDGETAGVDQANPPAPCGEGMKLDGDGQCVPADNSDAGSPVSTAPKESVYNGPNADEINANIKEAKIIAEEARQRVNKLEQVDELKQMEKLKENLYSVTKLSTSGQGFAKDDIAFLAQEGKQKLRSSGNYNFSLDLSPEWINESFGRQKVEEAISFSGDQSNKLAAMNDVFVLPGGKHLKSIRDLVRFKEIPEGADLVKFFKGSIPDNSSITEGSVETPGTHTVTTVTLDADTVTGVAQEITQSQVEDSPFEIFDYIAQTARAEVLEHEATLVFDTAAVAATAGNNINAAGTGAMTASYVSQALEYWETEGYDTSFGNSYIVMHPKQLRELRESTDLTRFLQVGDANITKTGRLTHLYGVELIPSTAINATTNYHAVGGIKGHTFALASKRELMIDMRKIPRESAFDWMWTQRKGAKAFDEASYQEIESAL